MVGDQTHQRFLDGDINLGDRRPVILDTGRERLGCKGRLRDVVGDLGHLESKI